MEYLKENKTKWLQKNGIAPKKWDSVDPNVMGSLVRSD